MGSNIETIIISGATAYQNADFSIDIVVSNSAGDAIDWTGYTLNAALLDSTDLTATPYEDTSGTLVFTGTDAGILTAKIVEADVDAAIAAERTRWTFLGWATDGSIKSRILEIHGAYRAGAES